MTNLLHGVAVLDESNATAVGMNATIIRTTDGGASWTPQYIGALDENLAAVSFGDTNTGVAVGWGNTPPVYPGLIVRTTDGGAGFGTILRTTNGGANWTRQVSGTRSGLWAVSFVGADSGTAIGTNGTILRTNTGGM